MKENKENVTVDEYLGIKDEPQLSPLYVVSNNIVLSTFCLGWVFLNSVQ